VADTPNDTPDATQGKDWEDLRDRGLKARDRGDYAVARAYYQRAMAAGCPAAMALNDIACIYEAEGQIDEALAWWQRSAQADAGYVYPRYNTGRLLAIQGHHEKALDELIAAAAIDAGHSGCRYWAGLVCLKLGRVSEAEAYLREAAALDPESQCTQNILAYCVAARADDWPEAAASAERQGYADLNGQDYDFARWWFQQAIRAGADEAKMMNEVGRCHDCEGDTDRAITCWHEAANADPTLVYPPYNIGVKLVAAGKFEESLKHLRIAIRNDPGHNWARLFAGWAFLNLDRVDEAREQYRRAAAIDPDAGAVANHLAYCEARLRGDRADAAERAHRQGSAE
jgi:tetratricopeptide (TPR) repeat protein